MMGGEGGGGGEEGVRGYVYRQETVYSVLLQYLFFNFLSYFARNLLFTYQCSPHTHIAILYYYTYMYKRARNLLFTYQCSPHTHIAILYYYTYMYKRR